MRYVEKCFCLSAILLVPFTCGCATNSAAYVKERIDFAAIKSPIIIKGDAKSAFRDPAVIYHEGVFYMYYTCWFHEDDGVAYSYTAMSKSRDLANWTAPKVITPRDINLNFSSPGNVIRFDREWILCLQTYPTGGGRKYGDKNCRVYIMRSKDLENWGPAEILMVKGPDVPFEEMGRLIDAYLVEDKDEPGKWWCFFDDNAANMSWSYDLSNWHYFGRIPAGENACVLVENDEYILFHSPENGIGMKRSKDMKNWKDWGPLITLGQADWDWAKQRLTAGFVLDLRNEPGVGKYLMFYHAEPPGGFKKYASLGIAWSDDLVTWEWPGKYDFCSEMRKRIQAEFAGPTLRFRIYTSKNPADIVKAHYMEAGPVVAPPRRAFLPWRWRDEHVHRDTYYDGSPAEAPYNSELVEDVLMMEALDIPCGAYWIDRPWATGPFGYDGGKDVTVSTPLHKIPIFIRQGAKVNLGDLNELYLQSLKIAGKQPNMKDLEAKADF